MFDFSNSRILKFAAAGLFLNIGLIITYLQLTDGMFPSLSVLAFVAAIILIAVLAALGPLTKRDFLTLLGLIVTVSIVYRLMIFQYPASLVGQDPDLFAEWIAVVMETGDAEIPSDRYDGAPIFIIISSISGLLFAVTADAGLVIHPIIYGVLAPLLPAIFASRMVDSFRYESTVVAALLGMVAPFAVRASFWPTANHFSIVLFLLITYLLARYLSENKLTWYLAACVPIIALLFTHDLPVLLLSTVLFVILIVELSFRYIAQFSMRPAPRSLFLLTSLLAVIFISQMIHITEFLGGFNRYLATFFISSTDSAVGVQPAGGTTSEINIYDSFRFRTYMALSLLFGGVSWLYFGIGKYNSQFTRVVLLIIATLVGLAVISLPANIISNFGIGHERFYMLAELMVMAIVGPVIALGVKRGDSTMIVTLILTIILVLFLSFSAVATPDHPNTPQFYLTEGEASAKEFSNDHAIHTVHTDSYYASETISFDNHSRQAEYEAADYELFNKTISHSEFNYIMYRTDVGVYRLQTGIFDGTYYRLSWEPEQSLNQDYNRIFDNEQVVHYQRSH